MDMTDFYDAGNLVFIILILMLTQIISLPIGVLFILFLTIGNLIFRKDYTTRYRL